MSDMNSELHGLSSEEVAARVADGRVNHDTDVKTKSIWQIFATHAFTLFNAVNIGMAALIFFTGEYRNMLFLTIVGANLVIGVFQEIRAKRMVDKLTLITQKQVTVIRGGAELAIAPSELVLDDLMRLSHGDQVPADSEVVEGNVYCDESLLTGESIPVAKAPGSELFSGSFIESGSLVARVTKVGRDGYAAKINAEAKYVKDVKSEILATLKAIIRLGTELLIPLGIGLFLRTVFMESASIESAILSTTSAVLGMIPQGLVLLTSTVLAIATTRLGSRGVLVQQSYCVETLARVDTLCLDKTGTITSGEMEVAHVRSAAGIDDGRAVSAFTAIAKANCSDVNETAKALLSFGEGFAAQDVPVAARAVAFSSSRKYSGCVLKDGRGLVMGAAQFVLGEGRMAEADALCEDFDDIERRMVVCECDGFTDQDAIIGSRYRPSDHGVLPRAGGRAPRDLGRRPAHGLRHRAPRRCSRSRALCRRL